MKSSVFILTYEIYASCFNIIIMKMCHATLYNCIEKIDKNDRKNEYIKEKKKNTEVIIKRKIIIINQ